MYPLPQFCLVAVYFFVLGICVTPRNTSEEETLITWRATTGWVVMGFVVLGVLAWGGFFRPPSG